MHVLRINYGTWSTVKKVYYTWLETVRPTRTQLQNLKRLDVRSPSVRFKVSVIEK